MSDRRFTAAVVQSPPVFLDLAATLERACGLVAEAAAAGARIVAFSESFLPGFPAWVHGLAGWDDPAAKRLFARLAHNSVQLGDATDRTLAGCAREHGVFLVMGATERDASHSRGTLYNSLLFYDDRGERRGVHRKLMPTHAERIVWGLGDGSSLRAYDSPVGRIGGLICWEHWMPLARFALHAAGEQVHVAAWPEANDLHRLASRHYAFEGRCYVLCASQFLRVADLPEEPDLRAAMLAGATPEGDVLLPGGSGIIGPDGQWVAGPAGDEPTIVYGEIDLDRIVEEQLALDTAGHYHRPDIFSVTINAERRAPVIWHTPDNDEEAP